MQYIHCKPACIVHIALIADKVYIGNIVRVEHIVCSLDIADIVDITYLAYDVSTAYIVHNVYNAHIVDYIHNV